MNRLRITRHIILPFAVLLLIAGCIGKGTQQPTKFYVLNSLYSAEKEVAPVVQLPDLAIGVGPVKLPQHLNRKQIVTRAGQNEVTLSEFDHWAGNLQENILRVLAENLTILLGTEKVGYFPWTRAFPVQYRIQIIVTRFDGMPGEEAILRARWGVLDSKGKNVLREEFSNIEAPTGDDTMDTLVAAKSRTLEILSREIAEAVKDVDQQ